MSKDRLTGRFRHRVHKQWGRDAVLILQVEVTGWRTGWECGHPAYKERSWWQDVKPEQLLTSSAEYNLNVVL
jgi:hypothetical protein